MKITNTNSEAFSLLSDGNNTAHTRSANNGVELTNTIDGLLATATAAGAGTPFSYGPTFVQTAIGLTRAARAYTGHNDDAGPTTDEWKEVKSGLTLAAGGVAGFVPALAILVNAPLAVVDFWQAVRHFLGNRE